MLTSFTSTLMERFEKATKSSKVYREQIGELADVYALTVVFLCAFISHLFLFLFYICFFF